MAGRRRGEPRPPALSRRLPIRLVVDVVETVCAAPDRLLADPAVAVLVHSGEDIRLDQRVAGRATADRLAGNCRPADREDGEHCCQQSPKQEPASHLILLSPVAPQRRNGIVARTVRRSGLAYNCGRRSERCARAARNPLQGVAALQTRRLRERLRWPPKLGAQRTIRVTGELAAARRTVRRRSNRLCERARARGYRRTTRTRPRPAGPPR